MYQHWDLYFRKYWDILEYHERWKGGGQGAGVENMVDGQIQSFFEPFSWNLTFLRAIMPFPFVPNKACRNLQGKGEVGPMIETLNYKPFPYKVTVFHAVKITIPPNFQTFSIHFQKQSNIPNLKIRREKTEITIDSDSGT